MPTVIQVDSVTRERTEREMTEEGVSACPSHEITPTQRIAQIKADLSALDTKSIRALREGNQARLGELEVQAVSLRRELVHYE